ncbi:MAG TPA: glycosyltransferase family 9 protein [Verrucomicrobiae bacterium]|jgi:ADP-heptose:LPS heptosyltransferase|nr:glycosyltransferase family 9 protein [Verrucomicrobiae bacterium]
MTDGTSDFLRRTRGARKILVVDLGFLGDSVHLIPALWELRRQYPGAELHTLSAPVGAEILALAPCVTRAWAYPLGADAPPWWRQGGLIAALRRERFDVAYNFSGADRTIFLTALSGARERLAQEGGRRHFWNRWLIPNWVARRDRNLPIYEQRRQVLVACGFSLEPARFDLALPAEAMAWARQAASGRPVNLSINASGAIKEWPVSHWAELVRGLWRARPDLTFVAACSGKAREQERLQALAAALGDARLATFPGLGIPRLAALLQSCRLHIGSDSGPLHLALALGTPTLALFRQYEGMQEWFAQGNAHRALIASDLADIASEAVTSEALSLLN